MRIKSVRLRPVFCDWRFCDVYVILDWHTIFKVSTLPQEDTSHFNYLFLSYRKETLSHDFICCICLKLGVFQALEWSCSFLSAFCVNICLLCLYHSTFTFSLTRMQLISSLASFHQAPMSKNLVRKIPTIRKLPCLNGHSPAMFNTMSRYLTFTPSRNYFWASFNMQQPQHSPGWHCVQRV